MGLMNTTTSLLWIPPGVCKEQPVKVEYTEQEYTRISELTGLRLEESKQAYEKLKAEYEAENDDSEDKNPSRRTKNQEKEENTSFLSPMSDESEDNQENAMEIDTPLTTTTKEEKTEGKKNETELDIYHFSDYENDSDNAIQQVNLFANLNSIVDGDDPYLELDDPNLASETEKEEEDLRITNSDHVLCLATHQDGLSVLEFQVWTENHTLYPHHDILLPTFPLCLARSPLHLGNWLAVGTMQPEVEIWEIDQLDPLVPVAMLGEKKTKKTILDKKKRIKKKNKYNDVASHTDGVLSLAWNQQHGVLASGSADQTVKLWDPQASFAMKRSFDFGQKVSTLLWTSPTEIFVGTHDAQCAWMDTRTPHQRHSVVLPCDPEQACLVNQEVWVSLENGGVIAYDLQQGLKSLWHLQAHTTACTSLDYSSYGLATVGDTDVKVWNTSSSMSLIHSKPLQLGSLFSCSWCPGQAGVLAVGGERGSVTIDFNSNTILNTHDEENEEEIEEGSDIKTKKR